MSTSPRTLILHGYNGHGGDQITIKCDGKDVDVYEAALTRGVWIDHTGDTASISITKTTVNPDDNWDAQISVEMESPKLTLATPQITIGEEVEAQVTAWDHGLWDPSGYAKLWSKALNVTGEVKDGNAIEVQGSASTPATPIPEGQPSYGILMLKGIVAAVCKIVLTDTASGVKSAPTTATSQHLKISLGEAASLAKGAKLPLFPRITDQGGTPVKDGREVSVQSGDDNVATVTLGERKTTVNGYVDVIVTGVNKGNTTITLTVSGEKKTMKVTVDPATISVGKIEVPRQEPKSLLVTAYNPDGTKAQGLALEIVPGSFDDTLFTADWSGGAVTNGDGLAIIKISANNVVGDSDIRVREQGDTGAGVSGHVSVK